MSPLSFLRPPVLTVAIHASEVRWTLGSPGRVSRSGAASLVGGIVDDGVVLEPAAAGEILRESAGFPKGRHLRVVLALPAQRSMVRLIEVPALRGREFNELVQREIRREMPALADNACVSWKRRPDRDGKARVFIVGVARDVLDSHVSTLRAAGLKPAAADLSIIAAARAAGSADCIVAHVEEEEIELGIFCDGTPVILRFVVMSAPAADPAWGDQIAEELARTLKFYRDSHRLDDVAADLPILIVGGAAQRAMLVPQIAAATGHELSMPALQPALTIESDTVRFAANIGLVMKDLAA
jgi:Tfp pilus assembly PilM family ATPase